MRVSSSGIQKLHEVWMHGVEGDSGVVFSFWLPSFPFDTIPRVYQLFDVYVFINVRHYIFEVDFESVFAITFPSFS